MVVVGPCSIHDVDAAPRVRARAARGRRASQRELCDRMRVYFEKPRTTVGWKGLINDPHLDGTFAVNEGLRSRARLLLDLPSSGCRSAASSSTRSRRSTSPTWSAGARSARAPPRARPTASWRPACRCRSASRTAPTATCRIAIDAIKAAAAAPLPSRSSTQRLGGDRRHARQPRLPPHPARRQARPTTTPPAWRRRSR